jgi:phosphatidylglycerol:prolipoprotein diacylglycerol transferase
VRGYGTMMLLGVTSGVGLACYRAKRVGLNPEIILTLAFWVFISGIVGARVFYVIEYWAQFRHDNPTPGGLIAAVLNISQGGLVVYGSFIAVMGALILFVRKYRVPGLALADLIAPSMLLGLAFGRIGCMMNGCCFGGQCELPWAVQFPWGSPPHVRQVEQNLVDVHGLWFDGKKGEPAVIASVVAGSEAEKAGLRAGDRIRAIGGEVDEPNADGQLERASIHRDIATIDDAQSALLRIHGAGAEVNIQVSRPIETNAAAKADGTRLASVAGAREMVLRSASWTVEAEPRSLSVHPAQIYSSIDAALICLFLLAYAPFRTRDGEVIAMLLLVYPVTRFLEEIIRSDEFSMFGTGLTISQIISVALFVAGVILWAFLRSRPRHLAFEPAVVSQPVVSLGTAR